MSKRKKIVNGFTRQGVKSLDYIKAPPGRKLSLPGMSCEHPIHMIREDLMSGATRCTGCNSIWDFDQNPIS